MKIWSQFTKENFVRVEGKFATLYSVSHSPIRERDRFSGHMLKCDIGGIQLNFAGAYPPTWVIRYITKLSDAPAS